MGEHIIGNFVVCLEGCEEFDEATPTIECCPRCGSFEIDEDFSLDTTYIFYNPNAAKFDRRCWECGHLWVSR